MKREYVVWLSLALFMILILFGVRMLAGFEADNSHKAKPEVTKKPSGSGIVSGEVVTSDKGKSNNVIVKYKVYNQRLVIKKNVNAYAKPGNAGKVMLKVAPKTEWGKSRNMLLVTGYAIKDKQRYWQVLLPIQPNGSMGWIAATPSVAVQKQNTMIRVNRGKRTVSLLVNGRTVKTFDSVIGSNKTPTPSGVFATRDVFATDPKLFTGSHMIVTTGYSNVLKTFDGGPPRVALHGRGPAAKKDRLGSAASNGCLRLNNNDISYLAHRVQAGTPIIVV